MTAAPVVVPQGFTREQLLACIDREIRYRIAVFPRRVEAGKLNQADADEEIARMRAVRAVIAQIPPTQATLGFDNRRAVPR